MRRQEQYTLFDTSIGTCGVAWSEAGLTQLQLPEADRGATESRLADRCGGVPASEPPASITHAIGQIQCYLGGEQVELTGIELDLTEASPFHRKVYEAAREIGWGQTASYGELATLAGSPGAARSVGHAMSRNPVALVIPCHRIVASGNRLGGFSAYGGLSTKDRLLTMEGSRVKKG